MKIFTINKENMEEELFKPGQLIVVRNSIGTPWETGARMFVGYDNDLIKVSPDSNGDELYFFGRACEWLS